MKNHRFDLGSFVLALVLAGVLVLGISRPAGSAPEIGPPVSQVDRLADHNGEGEQEAPPKQVVMTSGGILRGNIGSVAHPAWKIADQSVTVNNSTEVKPGMDMGIPARAHVFTQPDGSMLAMTVERALKPPVAPASAPWENFSGMVTSVGSGGRWIIGGHMVMVNRNSQVKPGATLGNRVRVTFTAFGNGPLTALAIEPDMDGAREIEASFSGVAAAIPEGVFRWGTWTVEGQNFIADRVTEIQPGLEAGDNIRVTFIPLSDGIRAATRIERELEFSSELVAFQSLIMNSATPGATTSGPVTGAAPGSGTVPGGDSVAPGGSNSTGTGGSGGGSVNSGPGSTSSGPGGGSVNSGPGSTSSGPGGGSVNSGPGSTSSGSGGGSVNSGPGSTSSGPGSGGSSGGDDGGGSKGGSRSGDDGGPSKSSK